MKTQKQQKKAEQARKLNRQIWKLLNIERAVEKYGFPATKAAIVKWVNYQRENAKLLREKRELESQLAEIESKL